MQNAETIVRLYFSCKNPGYARLLREGVIGACPELIIALSENPARADILVTDSLETFLGLQPVNGQVFVVGLQTHHHHDLPDYYRVLSPDVPLRTLTKIVHEVAREKAKHRPHFPRHELAFNDFSGAD